MSLRAQRSNLALDCFAALAMTGSRNDGILEFLKIVSKSGFGRKYEYISPN